MSKRIDTVQKAWAIVQTKSNERFSKICREYDTAFCFRTTKNRRIFVMKKNGDTLWEEEIPKESFPQNIVRLITFK